MSFQSLGSNTPSNEITRCAQVSDLKTETETGASAEGSRRYATYVLLVLMLVYVFNFIDRQILSILAEEIKADIGVTDSEMGFLYGTAFAVFYAVFGIPLGRLADLWVRRSLISLGLMFWSAMTALSGTARSFAALAVFRIGVGIGEASATPAAFSMLSDYFPPRLRATVLSVYSSGIYIGAGIGLFLGGVIVDGWREAFPDPLDSPLGIKPWQAAFLVVGLPGLVMAIWVRLLKEPVRGQSEGIRSSLHPHPFRETWNELMAMLPPFALWVLIRRGDVRAVMMNLLALLATVLLVWWLIVLTGSTAQWLALGVGVYAAISWVQNLRIRDYPTFVMIFRCKTVVYCCLAFPCIAFVTYGLGFWAAPFLIRSHGANAGQVGMYLGASAAIGGWIGVTASGFLADILKRRYGNARLYIGMAVPLLSAPFGLLFVTTDNLVVAYVCNFFFSVFSPRWTGPAASTLNDLVMPRMRAIASAFYIMMITFIGLALGPYLIGLVSDNLIASGMGQAPALGDAMLWSLLMLGVSVIFLIQAMRTLPQDEASRVDRARLAGEVV